MATNDSSSRDFVDVIFEKSSERRVKISCKTMMNALESVEACERYI